MWVIILSLLFKFAVTVTVVVLIVRLVKKRR